jgi:lysophospholipase L1-like esterase
MLGDAASQNPTFFTLSEIGGNDVLSYATSGGIGEDQTGNFNPASYGNNDITDPTVFGQVFNGIVAQLTANGSQGVLANIPYITDLPYFTTVPHNPVPLNATTAAQLNAGYALYNGGITQAYAFLVANTPLTQEMADAEIAKRTITFSAGDNNALVIIDEDLRDLTPLNAQLINLRQATANDLITLPTSSAIPAGAGTATPLGDQSVLTPEEQLAVITATDAYNQTIDDTVQATGLAFVDFKAILQQASTVGIENGDFILTTDLVTGGLVSLDGIHLTAQGYAIMANEFMKATDKTYGSNFEASNSLFQVVNYPTNYSPLLP